LSVALVIIMGSIEIESLWRSAFGDAARPQLYTSQSPGSDDFLPLNDPQNFIMDLANLSHPQLYAASANNQIAMKLAQDEYLQLDRQIAQIKGKESSKNPRSLQEPDVFEERKESQLYGYKYEAHKPALLHAGIPGLRSADELTDKEKHDVRLFQEPFEQGGFVPTEKQYKAMLAKARNPKNIDGWKPVEKNGKRLIPKQQVHHDEYTMVYVRRAIDENGELIRPESAGSEESSAAATPTKVVNKRLTRTRFDGRKVPPTRDVSEASSAISTPGRKRPSTPLLGATQEATPAAKRRKFNTLEDQPSRPYQYRRATEVASQNASAKLHTDSSTPQPSWALLSPAALRQRKWTDEELVEAVKQDHLWLHDDPAKAEDWKHKIINGVNPVRSFSMFKKWAYWKDENKDKRPRSKKDAGHKEVNGTGRGKRAVGRRRQHLDGIKHSSSATPVSEPVNGVVHRPSGRMARGRINSTRSRRAGWGVRNALEFEEGQDEVHPSTETEPGDRTEDEVQQQIDRELNDNPKADDDDDVKTEDSESIIVVNGERPIEMETTGKRSQTSTPVPKKGLPGMPTPTRRSLRNARRGSA